MLFCFSIPRPSVCIVPPPFVDTRAISPSLSILTLILTLTLAFSSLSLLRPDQTLYVGQTVLNLNPPTDQKPPASSPARVVSLVSRLSFLALRFNRGASHHFAPVTLRLDSSL
ncbi:hypothetical protein FJTKL_12120 [Diaporthe vaccinii]|uniref:Uncharacterized protein n=1 Tax=Diaporthe vaccinii TaxID=105482 RepID=A0ABR4EFD9_9PEZI